MAPHYNLRGEQYHHNNPSPLTDQLYLAAARVISGRLLLDLGITCVINATLELPTMAYQEQDALQIAVEDRVASKLYVYFDLVADKIHSVHKSSEGKLLIYCRAGMSRSASLCIAYFIKYHGMSFDDAFNYVKERRPIIHPNIGFLRQLRDYEKKLRSPEGRVTPDLPPFKYADTTTFNSFIEANMLEYEANTKVIKPKPKPRHPKVGPCDRLDEAAETYSMTCVQICDEMSCQPAAKEVDPGEGTAFQAESTTEVNKEAKNVPLLTTSTPLELVTLCEEIRNSVRAKAPFSKISEPAKIASLQNCSHFLRTLRNSLLNVSSMLPKIAS